MVTFIGQMQAATELYRAARKDAPESPHIPNAEKVPEVTDWLKGSECEHVQALLAASGEMLKLHGKNELCVPDVYFSDQGFVLGWYQSLAVTKKYVVDAATATQWFADYDQRMLGHTIGQSLVLRIRAAVEELVRNAPR